MSVCRNCCKNIEEGNEVEVRVTTECIVNKVTTDISYLCQECGIKLYIATKAMLNKKRNESLSYRKKIRF